MKYKTTYKFKGESEQIRIHEDWRSLLIAQCLIMNTRKELEYYSFEEIK